MAISEQSKVTGGDIKLTSRQFVLLSLLDNYDWKRGRLMRLEYKARIKSLFGMSIFGFYYQMSILEDKGFIESGSDPIDIEGRIVQASRYRITEKGKLLL
jgi:hypothetical protein